MNGFKKQTCILRKRSDGGFTLIELLAVIAIVAIISAIAVAAIGNTREKARKITCTSNMRQLGVAILLYSNENGGMLPGTAHSSRDESWIHALSGYLEDVNAVRISPADPVGERRLRAEHATSYVANDLIFDLGERFDHRGRPLQREPGQGSLLGLENPAQTFLVFVGSERRGDDISNDHTHATSWAGNWSAFLSDVMPDIFGGGERQGARQSGSSNYLYADGRVEAIEASTVHGWITAGKNIALPPERRDQ